MKETINDDKMFDIACNKILTTYDMYKDGCCTDEKNHKIGKAVHEFLIERYGLLYRIKYYLSKKKYDLISIVFGTLLGFVLGKF